jgi:hypothetical protein
VCQKQFRKSLPLLNICIPDIFKDVEHFIANTSKTDTLELIDVYTGAGSIEDAGYVHTGRVKNGNLIA